MMSAVMRKKNNIINMKSRSNTMGTSVYPVSEKHQEEMEAELNTSGLDENMRRCEIACWKAVFKYCTNVNIDDLQWTDVIITNHAIKKLRKTQVILNLKSKMMSSLTIATL